MKSYISLLPVELIEYILNYLVITPTNLITFTQTFPDLYVIVERLARKTCKKENKYGVDFITFLRFEKEYTCLFCPKKRYLKAFDGLRVCTDCMYSKMISSTHAKQQYMIDCNEYKLSCYTYCNQYNVVCRKYFEYQVKLVALEKYGDSFDALLEKRRMRRNKTEENRQLRRNKIMSILADLPEILVDENKEVSRYINTGRPCTHFEEFSTKVKNEIETRWNQEKRLIQLEKALHANNVYMHPCHACFRDYVYNNHGTIEQVIKEAVDESWLFKYTEYRGGYDNAKKRAIRTWLKKPIVYLTEKPPEGILEKFVIPLLEPDPFLFTKEYQDCNCGNRANFLLDYKYYDACSKCIQHCTIVKNVYTCGLECLDNYLELDYRYRKEEIVEFVCYQDSFCYNCKSHLWVSVDLNGIQL